MSDSTTTRKATTRPEYRRGMTKSQIREERRTKTRLRKLRRQRLYLFLASFVAVGLIIGLLAPSVFQNLFSSSQSLGEVVDASADPDAGRHQISVGQAHSGYPTVPATSGPHYFTNSVTLSDGTVISSPADWGRYDVYIPDEVLVQNLENGGIGLHYDCPEGCPDIEETLASIPPGHWAQFVMSPYPGLLEQTGSPIAVTGWRHHIYLPDVSTESIDNINRFVATYQNRAPEARFDNPINVHGN